MLKAEDASVNASNLVSEENQSGVGEQPTDKLAVVILNWNGAKMLARFLPTVLEYSKTEAIVWVADNASTDDSVALLAKHFPQVRLLRLDRNYGFAEGYNKALAQIKATYYLLLNSDVEVTHHWLTPLIEYMDAHGDVAACQPKLLSQQNKDSFEYAGAGGGFIDHYGYPFCRGRVFDTVEVDNGQYDDICDLLWATGACLMVRAADYWKCGGLDGHFFAHNEEIDFCWRLRLLGRRVVAVPDSVVYHVGGGTLPKKNPMKTYLNFRNNLTMLYKNLPDKDLKSVMRMRFILDYVAAIETLVVQGHWGDFKAILKARRDFSRWKADFAKERQRIQQTRVLSVVQERRPYSLLWQYYVHGKKFFSQLEPLIED